MINLIPESTKKNIRTEYRWRVVAIWFFILGTASLMVTLLLLPTYVLLSSQVAVYGQSAASASAKVAEFDLSESSLTFANKQVDLLLEHKKTRLLSDFVADLDKAGDKGILIKEFSLERKGIALESAKISGVAETREALSEFGDALADVSLVEGVEFSMDSLAKSQDIEFSIPLILTEEK